MIEKLFLSKYTDPQDWALARVDPIRTASSCTSISSSCTSIIFKISIIDMSKLQNYSCCYKRRFSIKGVRCISE